jgi:hypothetical protein
MTNDPLVVYFILFLRKYRTLRANQTTNILVLCCTIVIQYDRSIGL